VLIRKLLFVFVVVLALSTVPAFAQDDLSFDFSGVLNDSTPSETYSIELQAGELVVLTTVSSSVDTVLSLYDSNGTLLAENDDAAPGSVLTSQIVYTPDSSGTYAIEVRRFDDSSTGDYGIIVQEGIAPNLSDTAQFIFEESGTLSASQTEVKFSVDLNAGDTAIITTLATSGGIDTTLDLRDAGGTSITDNDDIIFGSNPNSQIIFAVPETGSYGIVVSSYTGDAEGDFILSVALDSTVEVPVTADSVTGDPLGNFSGFIDNDNEQEDYTVDLVAGQTIYAMTTATSGDLDTVLTLLDPAGETLAVNDDFEANNLNSAFAFTVEADGTYTVQVGRYGGGESSGNFDLVLLSVDASVAEQLEELATQVVSLSGPERIIETANFRVHYTIEGVDAATPEYAQAFADMLEELYDIQINQIGWAAPPRNSDGLYDTYLAEILEGEDGAMGYAYPVTVVGDNPNTSAVEETSTIAVLVVDNDFAGMEDVGNPQSLLRATTTHEFNHAIQFGYGTDEREYSLDWLFESTATWIETVTVGDEQDATKYVGDSFTYPELCFATLDPEQGGQLAYGDWTFLQTLADQYGESIVIRLWENTIPFNGFDVLSNTLQEVGTTIPDQIARWRVQTFALDYDLALLFERTVWLEETIDGAGTWTFSGSGIQELGANYFALDMGGVVDVALDGGEGLEVWALGVNDQTVDAFRLGVGGAFDTAPYNYTALMVVDTTIPADTASCSFRDYELKIDSGSGSNATPVYQFSSAEFQSLTNE
jgi:Bacterial pre-peptidase C-terminal domain